MFHWTYMNYIWYIYGQYMDYIWNIYVSSFMGSVDLSTPKGKGKA